jgi:hypothetical protein
MLCLRASAACPPASVHPQALHVVGQWPFTLSKRSRVVAVEFAIQILHMEAVLASVATPTGPSASSPARQGVRGAEPPRYILVTLIRVCCASSFYSSCKPPSTDDVL